jgi:hypothetical protein
VRVCVYSCKQQLTAGAVEQRVTGKKNDVSKVIFKENSDGKVTAALLVHENLNNY